MFEERTLFFVGAGASCSYGFPTGPNLITQICENLHSDPGFIEYLVDSGGVKREDLTYFRESFNDARNTTIDEFLEIRDDLKEIGRSVVSAKLITLENRHLIYRANQDWLSLILANRLKNVKQYEDALNAMSKYTFYTLNYDRSIEQIIDQTLRARYLRRSDSAEKALEILSTANNVIHGHGQLGLLSTRNGVGERAYDMELPSKDCFHSIRSKLKFWDDVSETSKTTMALNASLAEAESIVFLGFGFHPGILKRIDKEFFLGKRIFSTRFGMKISEQSAVENYFGSNRIPLRTLDHDDSDFTELLVERPNVNCDDFIRKLLER